MNSLIIKKLEDYCRGVLAFGPLKNARKEIRKGWMFGAINFAFESGLITVEECEELEKKYIYTEAKDVLD